MASAVTTLNLGADLLGVIEGGWGELAAIPTQAYTTLVGIVGTITAAVTTDQIGIIGKVAAKAKAAMAVAGATWDTVKTAALNELSADEGAELNKVETSLLNALIDLAGAIQTQPTA